MDGGSDNDTYVIDNANDIFIEQAGQGNDTIISSISLSLKDWTNFENLTLTSSIRIVEGNDSNNIPTGNCADNLVHGYLGDDTLYSLDGNDQLLGDEGTDKLYGGVGDDTLDGGAGDDMLQGGAGDDVYVFGFGTGRDTILQGESSPDRLIFKAGISAAEITWTRSGDNLVGTLTSETDQVTIVGWFLDESSTPAVSLNDGSTINPGAKPVATPGPDEETGRDRDDRLTGLAGNDTLRGGLGNDILEGGADADTMIGGAGDDTYYVGDIHDVVIEESGGGTDLVIPTVSFSLERIETWLLNLE